jgi:phage tail protein X
MTTYATKQNDVLDDVVFRFYGGTDNRIVETVLEANPGLSDFGPVLPAGLTVKLPERPTAAKATITRLWS